ncbi:hypothetical protein DI005_20625 [Prauserella sp. PE36]|uniref:hypothetical protein n=1 Tax=Prauserella sp. PE36 TaxID=1504709 RepID=UPI000DE328EF|nr:hypothetical protein [Prauserella sp. PE36]RBM17937.1 hypothetical protein DI005_20625 [Prauserella sp. PE36]
MSDDRWVPLMARRMHSTPPVGTLIAYDHAVYRVIEVRVLPADRWTEEQRLDVEEGPEGKRDDRVPRVVTARPVHIVSDDPGARDHDIHLCAPRYYDSWDTYPDEHYPVCATCLEPLPCREKHSARVAQRHMARLARYEQAGVCPACGETVTHRQRSIRFEENIENPIGPPVTFHLRSRCFPLADQYDKRWAAAEPGRRTRLSCPGHLTTHNDGTYDCTELADCPGPDLRHASLRRCECPDCHARGEFSCYPLKGARRNGATEEEIRQKGQLW